MQMQNAWAGKLDWIKKKKQVPTTSNQMVKLQKKKTNQITFIKVNKYKKSNNPGTISATDCIQVSYKRETILSCGSDGSLGCFGRSKYQMKN